MARTAAEAAIVGGPTIESTRDYWVLHLECEHRAERTISTYLNALRRLDEFLAAKGMPRELRAIRRVVRTGFVELSPKADTQTHAPVPAGST